MRAREWPPREGKARTRVLGEQCLNELVDRGECVTVCGRKAQAAVEYRQFTVLLERVIQIQCIVRLRSRVSSANSPPLRRPTVQPRAHTSDGGPIGWLRKRSSISGAR